MVALAAWGATAGVVDPILLALFTVAVAVLLVGLVAVGTQQERLEPVVRRFASHLPQWLGDRAVSFFGNASGALAILHDPRVLAQMLAFTGVVWALEAVAMGAALAAFHVEAGPASVVLLMVALNLTFVVPLTPGNLGTHQLVSVLVLGAVGTTNAEALAFSLGLQGTAYVMTLALGAVYFHREGIDFATIRRETA
jgi:uncharacterized membrane protein YbhN (UPF0104 family)